MSDIQRGSTGGELVGAEDEWEEVVATCFSFFPRTNSKGSYLYLRRGVEENIRRSDVPPLMESLYIMNIYGPLPLFFFIYFLSFPKKFIYVVCCWRENNHIPFMQFQMRPLFLFLFLYLCLLIIVVECRASTGEHSYNGRTLLQLLQDTNWGWILRINKIYGAQFQCWHIVIKNYHFFGSE